MNKSLGPILTTIVLLSVAARAQQSIYQQAYLKASNTGLSDGPYGNIFGYGVAISGDTVVVASPNDDSKKEPFPAFPVRKYPKTCLLRRGVFIWRTDCF